MKKLYILLIALFVVNGACQRSQFATTTRHSSNGKVTYINHYPAERTKFSKVKCPKNNLNETKAQNNPAAPGRTEVGKLPGHEITKINPAPISENLNLIASTSNKPTILPANESRVVPAQNLILSSKSQVRSKTRNFNLDTNKKSASKSGTARVRFAKIKFKNGHEVLAKILYQNHDTLKYRLINEPDSVRIVMMDKVNTILPDPRKTEKLGLAGFILSLLGLIPIIGIPFAILALIFGLSSLRKIKRFPEKFKGKGFATASAIIGGSEIIIYIILAIIGIILVIGAISSATPSCTVRID